MAVVRAEALMGEHLGEAGQTVRVDGLGVDLEVEAALEAMVEALVELSATGVAVMAAGS